LIAPIINHHFCDLPTTENDFERKEDLIARVKCNMQLVLSAASHLKTYCPKERLKVRNYCINTVDGSAP